MARWETALDLQMETFHWWQTEKGIKYAEGYLLDKSKKFPDLAEVTARLLGAERSKLYAAEPIYVSEDVQSIIETAAETFEPEPLYESDLITPAGFALFPRPFVTKDAYEKRTAWRALAWFPAQSLDEQGMPINTGISLSIYTHVDDWEYDDYALEHEAEWLRAGQAARLPGMPTLELLHITPWMFGEGLPASRSSRWLAAAELPDRGAVSADAAHAAHRSLWQIAQVFFRLSMQQIATRDRYQPPRAVRRRAQRAQLPEKYVTVIQLRRKKPAHEGEVREVEWTHRWLVGGHWRNQYFPSLDAHRQVWIASYIKGPEELPLVIRKERVFEFVR